MTLPAGALLVAVAALIAPGCSSEKPGTVAARVGDSVLTLEEATAATDTGAAGGPGRLRQYVASWVNTELLYQEALRLGIADDPAFRARLESLRRRLAAQEVLDLTIYADTTAVPDSVLRAYYRIHPDEFALPERHLKLRLATFRTREGARRFAAAVNGGRGWEGLIDTLAADPKWSVEVLSASGAAWYTRSTVFPQELWKVGAALGQGEVSFPVKTGEAFTVVQLTGEAGEGKPGEFEIVRDEVADRVMVETRRAKLDSLLGTLRTKYNVEMMSMDADRPGGAPGKNPRQEE